MIRSLDCGLVNLYADHMPRGVYHRREDHIGVLYRDGSCVFEMKPADLDSDKLIAILVYVLNQRSAK